MSYLFSNHSNSHLQIIFGVTELQRVFIAALQPTAFVFHGICQNGTQPIT